MAASPYPGRDVRFALLVAWVCMFASATTGLREHVQETQSSMLSIEGTLFEGGHFRAKRDTPSAPSEDQIDLEVSNLSSHFHLNNSHLHLMVHWPGAGTQIMFCLARDTEMVPGATSRFFMSFDNGKTFSDESRRLQIPARPPNQKVFNATIAKFYQHPLSHCHYVFTDTINKYIFTSTDCGRNFVAHKLEMSPEHIEFDKSKERVFLVHDLKADDKRLYVTKNFGETFDNVQSYVKAFFFKDLGEEDSMLYVQRLEPQAHRTTILASTKFFGRQLDTQVLYTNAHEFELREDFLFVTKPRGDDHPGELDLFVSMGGERFVLATFPTDLPTMDFHIVDATAEGQILVVVNHGPTLSNLYTSVKITPHEVEFSLSLERVMYYNPKLTWHDSWLKNTAGNQSFTDVYKVQGLRGIYVASQILEESLNKTEIEPDDLVSLITFDMGALWNPVQGPETDEEGRPFNACQGPKKRCSLHLSQQLSKRFPATRSIPITSSKSAVGIVMATGNMGHRLTQRSNVFMSADAGLSWHQVLKGSYYLTMGDHGGVLVAVKYFKTEGPTNELLYSTNEGLDWQRLKFHDEPLKIFGLLTEPGENTTTFTMFGTLHNARGIDWIIITVDLRDVFPRTCTTDDYKRWSPSDGSLGKHRNCILGRKEVYQRRAINTNCYNGIKYETVVTVENCACDRSDYICDFGFKKGDPEGWIQNCIKDEKYTHDPYAPPAICPPGSTFNRTRGYLKVRGDTCEEGRASLYEPLAVACPLAEEKEFLLVSQRESLVRVNLRNLEDVEVIPLEKAHNVISLDFDVEANCVLLADIELDQIFMQCLNGSEPITLVESHLESVEGMSYDWISKALYFVDAARRTIELIRVDVTGEGRMRKTILHGKVLDKPRGIAVHPLQGYLFFSDWSTKDPIIGRANMDGTDVQTLHQRPVVQWPNGLAIDFIAHRIYWAEAQKDLIASSDLDGKNYKKILERTPYMKHPFAVGVYKELMYWDDWATKSVYRADKNSGKGVVTVVSNMNGTMGLKIFSSIHRSGNNSCSSNPCSHLCTPLPENKYQCLCPDGMKSIGNQCKCPDGSDLDEKGRCEMKNGECKSGHFACNATNYCIPSAWQCDGEDDCGDQSDETGCVHDECKEFQFQCKNRKCIPSNWRCDFDNDCGDHSDEENCNKSPCSKDQFKCNNGQCISKKWHCDFEKDCQDGSDELNCTVAAVECKADEFKCPEGGQCLPNSWKCDGDKDCPSGADEVHCDNQTCRDWQYTCGDGHCIFSSWRCDNETDCPDGSDEVNCTDAEREKAATGNDNPSPQPDMPVPVFPKGQCKEWMFKCETEQCIPFWWKCDGSPDCDDGSDEKECPEDGTGPEPPEPIPGLQPEVCSADKFQCGDGECIYQNWVCDNSTDCTDGEDENPVICQGRRHCTHDQFRCVSSGTCIDFSRYCNDVQDCPDSSDEINCAGPGSLFPNNPGPVTCPVGMFSCDDNICYATSKMCDGHMDCYDGSDELGCDSHIKNRLAMDLLDVKSYETTARKIRVRWSLRHFGEYQNIKYQSAYAVLGTDKWVSSEFSEIRNFTHLFQGLQPFTWYNLTMNMQTQDGEIIKSNQFVLQRTLPDRPEKPVITNVEQIQRDIKVDWVPPSKPNGELTNYVIRMDPLGREWEVEADVTSFTIQGEFEVNVDYAFTVTAVNTAFTGKPSKAKHLIYESAPNLNKIESLVVEGYGDSTVKLSWSSVQGAKQYQLVVKSTNPLADTATYDCQDTKTTLTNLSPNTTYTISISPQKDENNLGPTKNVMVSTTGRSLPIPEITELNLTPDKGTSVKLSWKLPDDDKRKNKDWVYGIYYGTNAIELTGKLRAYVSNGDKSYTVDGLAACESYSFVVAIVGSDGKGPYGPPSKPRSLITKSSPGAPPKNLQAHIKPEQDPLVLEITWDASCQSDGISLGYMVTISDKHRTTNNPVFKKLTDIRTTKDIVLRLTKGVRYGTSYEITVQTDVFGAQQSQPIEVDTPPIPPPNQLIHFVASPEELKGQDVEGDMRFAHLVYWAPAKDLPGYLDHQSYTYKLYISRHSNMTEPTVIEVEKPPYLLKGSDLEPGRMYYMAVALVDSDGYSSPLSSLSPIETPVPDEDIVVSPKGIAGVIVPTLLVLLALAGALAYYVHRNRRITRSFQAFASRYSPASGAAILNQAALDEEDDSPIIRGFSDDEPLVIT